MGLIIKRCKYCGKRLIFSACWGWEYKDNKRVGKTKYQCDKCLKKYLNGDFVFEENKK